VEATNVDRYLGREAQVVRAPEKNGRGEVKIDGVEWTAVWEYPDNMVETGDPVEIVGVEGSKLIVKPR
jgi:membrane protein implicated in regulation of membrane protease activity